MSAMVENVAFSEFQNERFNTQICAVFSFCAKKELSLSEQLLQYVGFIRQIE